MKNLDFINNYNTFTLIIPNSFLSFQEFTPKTLTPKFKNYQMCQISKYNHGIGRANINNKKHF